jgi:hypothetical protein
VERADGATRVTHDDHAGHRVDRRRAGLCPDHLNLPYLVGGDCRNIYAMADDVLLIVVALGHRREVYDR